MADRYPLLKKGLLTSAFLLGSASLSLADIYRWTNDQGEVEYSDTYREGAEKIEVAPISTIEMPKPAARPDDQGDSDDEAAQPTPPLYKTLRITWPESDSAFHAGDGNVEVIFESQPELLPGHSYRLTLDGEVMAITELSSYTLLNVDRGTHQLGLEIINSSEVIISAPPVTFTIHRPSAIL